MMTKKKDTPMPQQPHRFISKWLKPILPRDDESTFWPFMTAYLLVSAFVIVSFLLIAFFAFPNLPSGFWAMAFEGRFNYLVINIVPKTVELVSWLIFIAYCVVLLYALFHKRGSGLGLSLVLLINFILLFIYPAFVGSIMAQYNVSNYGDVSNAHVTHVVESLTPWLLPSWLFTLFILPRIILAITSFRNAS